VRALDNPPTELKRGESFVTRLRITRRGTGLRSAVVAYHLTPKPLVGAGAVRLAGRTSLASLQRRREFERRVRVRLPRSVSDGRYYLTACVVVLRGTGAVTRRPCRASQRRVRVVAAGAPVDAPGGTGTSGTSTTGTSPTGTTPSSTPSDTSSDGDPDEAAEDKTDDPTRIAIFPWVTSGGFEENWLEGLALAALGLVGALVLLFVFLGEFLPSMGGKADYVARKAELDELVKQRTVQFALRESYVRGDESTTPEREAASAALTDDLEVAIQHKQEELTHERNRLLTIGMPIYVVLGAAFAVLFAANALQALLIGFGWTAVAERLGLKKELEERDTNRKDAIEELREDAKRGVEENEKAVLAAEARADKNAELALGFSQALREEAEARRQAEQQLEVERGQSARPQTPPQQAAPSEPPPFPAPGSQPPESSGDAQ